jgi:hypothetical protein
MKPGQGGPIGDARRITGPGATAIKYDILTALLVTAARGDAVEARLSLRLSLLVTARFNWRLGTFSVGQREMARMWGVTERTAKREIAEMRARGWIEIDVPAARGRVARYRLDLPVILRATMPHWDAVGPDFAARMAGAPEETAPSGNVVPLHQPRAAPPEADGTVWPAAAARLQAQDAGAYGAWFAALRAVDCADGVLTLLAPSRFAAGYVTTHHKPRLLAALVAEDRTIRDVRIIGG